ncbi:uncharacterized protein MONOS_14489 [Monocercomonoides exilis]|uniref:uncharacterized protein n=1 Tax=Monocercomonoides exilis TaxID=2049356 RepID=UPI00355A5CC2|nr:hypothetical protein MONOS_14489 [Monocercomonoides exilis]|eukprot:MONOS_14489.1-p1 / transcript=MONOS_14489.1 / gene=MONOS_14489 / organism=Monocercomonoides_exilis_PA203 / gene_product=unspecified product / transcript_product=unspecified product / location=Mono_scaffold01011:9102-17192(-) / protein_length=2696 / sequence_SO=supercontig / SO=protein_coding / is_pseudo=false
MRWQCFVLYLVQSYCIAQHHFLQSNEQLSSPGLLEQIDHHNSLYSSGNFCNNERNSFSLRVKSSDWSEMKASVKLRNASLEVRKGGFTPKEQEHVVHLEGKSLLVLNDCKITFCGRSQKSLICHQGGNIHLRNISFCFADCWAFSVQPVVWSQKDHSSAVGDGNLIVENSAFSCFELKQGPFLHSESISSVLLAQTLFFNISTAVTNRQSNICTENACTSALSNCVFCNVDDAIYGGIVASMNSQQAQLFATNCSFVRCFHSSNARNTSTHADISSSISFISTDFESCSGVKGGAITANDHPSLALCIVDCKFKNCTASGKAGALFVFNIMCVHIKKSNFSDNSASDRGTTEFLNISAGFYIGDCHFEFGKTTKENHALIVTTYIGATSCECFCPNEPSRHCASSSSSFSSDITEFSPKKEQTERIIPQKRNDEEGSLVERCSLQYGFAENLGGAVSIQESKSPFSMRECDFQHNRAKGSFIGCLELIIKKDSFISRTWLAFCYFYNNSVSGGLGNDVYLNHFSEYTLTSELLFNCFTTEKSSKSVSNSTHDFSDWIGETLIERYVSTSGSDNKSMCGKSESDACLTIGYATSQFVHWMDCSIHLLRGRYEQEGTTIEVGEKRIGIRGKGKADTTISSQLLENGKEALWLVNEGRLAMESLTFVRVCEEERHQMQRMIVLETATGDGRIDLNDMRIEGEKATESLSFSAPLLEAKGGKMNLNNVECTSMRSSVPLLSLSEGGLLEMNLCNIFGIESVGDCPSVVDGLSSKGMISCSECVFEGCLGRMSKKGGCMKFTVDADNEAILLNGTSFDGCEASTEVDDETKSGRGGGMYLGATLGSGIRMMELQFSRNKATCGRDIYFVCEDLRVSVTQLMFPFWSSIENKENSLFGSDDQVARGCDVDLFVFLEGFLEKEVYVGQSGEDATYCGHVLYPCKTLDEGMKHLGSVEEDGRIVVKENGVCRKQLNISGVIVNGVGSSEAVGIELHESLSGSEKDVLVSEADATWESVDLLFPSLFISPEGVESLLNSRNGVLKMCSFSFLSLTFQQKVGFCLLKADGGRVEMMGVKVIGKQGVLSFASSPFACSSSVGEWKMTKCLVGNMKVEGGSVLCIAYSSPQSECKISMQNCTITSVENTNGDVCVLNTMLNVQTTMIVELDAVVFEGCKSAKSERGGALGMSMGCGSSLSVVNDSQFGGCECSSESGKGGGVFVECKSDGDEYFFSSVVFGDTNKAKQGKNVFVMSDKLNSSVSMMHFGDWICTWKEEQNVFVGSDEHFGEGANLGLFLFEYFAPEIWVSSENGYDAIGCGDYRVMCGTVGFGLERLSSGESEGSQKTLSLMDENWMKEEMELDDHQIESGLENEKTALVVSCEVSGSREDAVLVSGKGRLRMLSISLGSALSERKSVLFAVNQQKSELCVERCDFAKQDGASGMNFNLIRQSSGKVEIIGCVIDELTMGASAFVVGGGSSCFGMNRTKVMRVEFEEGCALEIEDGGKQNGAEELGVGIEGCTFTSVQQTGVEEKRKPSIVDSHVLRSGYSFVVLNSSFEGCSSAEEREGGVLHCEYERGMKFEIKDSNGTSCSAVKGKGGFLFLDCRGEGELGFLLNNTLFRNNMAVKGRDVFVVCYLIKEQINEGQFVFRMDEGAFNRTDALYGRDSTLGEEDEDINLIGYVLFYRSDTVYVSSAKFDETRMCGSVTAPCRTVDVGNEHVQGDYDRRILIEGCVPIEGWMRAENVVLQRKGKGEGMVILMIGAEDEAESVISCNGDVMLQGLSVVFSEQSVIGKQSSVLLCEENGELSVASCSFGRMKVGEEGSDNRLSIPFSLVKCVGGSVLMSSVVIEGLTFEKSVLVFSEGSALRMQGLNCFDAVLCESFLASRECKMALDGINISGIIAEASIFEMQGVNGEMSIEKMVMKNVELRNGSIVDIQEAKPEREQEEENNEPVAMMSVFEYANITSSHSESAVIMCNGFRGAMRFANCTVKENRMKKEKGDELCVSFCKMVDLDSCIFEGEKKMAEEEEIEEATKRDELCKWNGSLVDTINSTICVKYSEVANSGKGGMSIWGGVVSIEKSEFWNNNPEVPGYVSARRNVLCAGAGELNVMSLKGGDGVLPNASLWILNDGCVVEGVVTDRESLLFIPVLEDMKVECTKKKCEVVFFGHELMPCNLSFQVVYAAGDSKQIDKHVFLEGGYISECEVRGTVENTKMTTASEETEVSVCILFGNEGSPSSTESFVVKNRSDLKPKGDERIVEGGKEGKSYWLLIVIVMAAVLLIVLIVSIVLAIRWRKQKRRTEELEEIVNDNIKKDPKAFEMVTMEMSPEEQWRRAEREAEKKNEERIKKRVYAKSLGHSESSEHLLSESGSTEYILGRDSDKIPDWALEKEEEEELRKRTPSPSISSTSTTDSESTFVRGEDLCPTTSSMSNLVDAMACSSPHEKLIVDLRDSLFMLLHGRNKTKEMAIGTLKEREMTAAQILFWVANLALHSFDEMENELSSLADLSPHIVLFSEHMVICIVMHSNCFFDSDSDSSSISSSTVATSASDDDDDDSLPSSAFEDENDFKKECLRWKAPELLMNKKMGATKESVSFSIGMMLWECLTLNIPFGEYEAETAGDKIVKGERPSLEGIQSSKHLQAVISCTSGNSEDRPTLADLKRHFIQCFPADVVLITVSDAIIDEEGSDDEQVPSNNNESCGQSES